MKLQTLKVTELEATILVLLITKSLLDQEKDYQENKHLPEEDYDKEGALSQIASLKALKAKVDILNCVF